MTILTFFRQHSFKLALGGAIFGFLCWLYCIFPFGFDPTHLQKIAIYLGLEILYDVLRHWCFKLVQKVASRLRSVFPFINDLMLMVSGFRTLSQQVQMSLSTVSLPTTKLSLLLSEK